LSVESLFDDGVLPEVSVEICVVSFDSASYVQGWVATAQKLGFGLAVADNHPSGSALRAIEALGQIRQDSTAEGKPAVRTLSLPDNPGFGTACNRLASTSSATWLMFLNPDATIIEFDTAVLHPNRLIGARQQLPSGVPIHASGVRYRVRDEILRSWFRRTPPMPTGTGYVSGGSLLIERSTFNALGGFDENFFLFYEDIDLCERAVQMGCVVHVDERWKVVHELGHSTRRDWTGALSNSYASGRLFHAKHRHSVRGYDGYVFVDSVARELVQRALSNTSKAQAYRRLARRSFRNFVQPSRKTP
jgi:GT2 family glycosyltransferase